LWRGGREAEGGGLLNRYTVINRIVGSNPIPSASHLGSLRLSTVRSANAAYLPNIARLTECGPAETSPAGAAARCRPFPVKSFPPHGVAPFECRLACFRGSARVGRPALWRLGVL
jgi:hypothetical protein